MNRKIVSGLLAGAAGMLFVGQANAAGETASQCNMASCCKAAATATAAATKATPDLLKTCPVSGEKLGEMAPPYVFTYKGQEVKLCCKHCKKDFDKNPDKYIAKIRAADKTTAEK